MKKKVESETRYLADFFSSCTSSELDMARVENNPYNGRDIAKIVAHKRTDFQEFKI